MSDAVPIPRKIRDDAAAWLERQQRPGAPVSDPAFERWLDADPRHRVAYQEILDTWQESAALGDTVAGRQRRLSRAPFWMRHKVRLAAGSAAAVVAAGAVVISAVPRMDPFELVTPVAAQTFETGKGQIKQVSLSDGTTATLDTASRIKVVMARRERRVAVEKGRVRLAVAHDPDRPFLIEAANHTVSADGATIDVSTDGGTPSVTTLSGEITVQSGAHSAEPEPVVVTARTQLNLITNAVQAAPSSSATWPAGMVSLDNTPLAEAVASLNRYAKHEVRLGDPGIGQLRVTGAFRASDTQGFLASMRAIYGLRATRAADGSFVLASSGVSTAEPSQK